MIPFSRCPLCAGEVVAKDVEKILRGGPHTAILTVHAEVCLHCGERYYTPQAVQRFEQIRAKLESGDLGGFQPVGQTFEVV